MIHSWEGLFLNKKLRWLLQPRYTAFFVVIFGFAVATMVLGNYLLAGVEFALSALFLGLVLLFKSRRRRELQNYLQRQVGKAVEIEYRVLDRGGRITDNYVDLLSLVEPGAIQMSVETDDT